MEIKTLNFIHDMLVEKETTTLNAKRAVFDAICQAEVNDDPNLSDLQSLYEKVRLSWREVSDALNDFEGQDW